jgi:hypothetical protein
MRKTLISVLIGFTSLVLVGLLGLALLSTNSAPNSADNGSGLSQVASQPLTSTSKSANPISITVYRGQPTQCNTSGDKRPPECFSLKQTAFAQMDATFHAKETASALTPRPTDGPISKVQQPKITLSKEDSRIYAITPKNIGVDADPTDKALRKAISLWRVSSIPNQDQTHWYEFYVWTDKISEHVYLLNTTGVGVSSEFTPELSDKYNKEWLLPKDIGAVTITNVTGPEGIVSFKGANGETGSFDLKNQQWHFDNSNVAIQAVTPDPTIFATIPEPTITPTPHS